MLLTYLLTYLAVPLLHWIRGSLMLLTYLLTYLAVPLLHWIRGGLMLNGWELAG